MSEEAYSRYWRRPLTMERHLDCLLEVYRPSRRGHGRPSAAPVLFAISRDGARAVATLEQERAASGRPSANQQSASVSAAASAVLAFWLGPESLPRASTIAVDELDHRHRRVVAVAEAGLEDAAVAARCGPCSAGRAPRRASSTWSTSRRSARSPGGGRAGRRAWPSVTSFSTTGPQVLRLRQRGDDLLVLDQRRRHVGEHRLAVLGRAVETAAA